MGNRPIWVWPVIAGLATLLVIFASLLILRPAADDMPRLGEVRSSGRADIGGPFTLINHEGETVTEADFEGRAMLIYFGFTYCPDICPFSLQIMDAALDQLSAEDRARIQPVLITIDPERDTVENMAAYVSSDAFPDGLVGLTGSPEQIAAVAAEYRVVYRRAEDSSGDPDAYVMDHSSIIYLMDETGTFSRVFSHGTSPADMAASLQDFLDEERAS